MEKQLLDMVGFKKLEKMPTKIELIATIARLLNQVRHHKRSCHMALYALLDHVIYIFYPSIQWEGMHDMAHDKQWLC